MNDFFQEDEILGKAYDSRLMKRLLKYLGPYKLYTAVAVGLLLIGSLVDLAGPYLMKLAIDVHIANKDISGLSKVALLFLGVLIASFIIRYTQIYIMEYMGQRVMYDMRVQIFSHLQEMSLSFYDKNPVGRLITRLTSDVEALNEMLTSGVITIFGDIFTLMGIMVVMLLMNWKLALVTFSILPLLFYATILFRLKVRDTYRAVRLRIARVNANLQENVTGMKIVQLFNREKRNFDRFDELNIDHLNALLRAIFYYAVFFPVVEVMGAVAMALIIWYGGGEVIRNALTIGVLVAFIQYANRFFRPIRDLSEKYNIMQAAMAASERIFSLLDTPIDIKNPEEPVILEDRFKGDIEFKNVWLAYADDDYVLKDMSFKIKSGESVAFVGATGAGKTSIISLLARFYDIQKGEILIDGVDIRKMDKHQLRSHIGVVQQDVFLFSGSIEKNIRLGNEDIDDRRVRDAARYVNAHKFIQRLPDRYRQKVKERGATLSVGQKQLLAFARALAFNPDILLVLDEATSSVDTETEFLIQDALVKLMKGRTSIIIAHRLSTIKRVDRIIVIHKGEIKEVGTHQELLDKRGIYYRLYQLQYKEQEAMAERELSKII